MTKEKLKKENAKLQEKISILLSCKNCPENKGGWICAKEYENKCLTQKIEFIKELEEEKCELLGIIQGKDKVIQELKKENAELRNIAEFQQSSNMSRYFENKKLKDENAELKEKLNIRSCQNCKHNNKSCPND